LLLLLLCLWRCQTLAVASHDAKVYLYNTLDFSARAKCRKSTSAVTHVDFSSDSVFIQTNDRSYEILYFDAETGIQQVSATAMKDVDWASWTAVLGWPVQGIWPAFSDGTDINAVDRSHNKRVIATADDFGRVKVFRNPCVEKGSLAVQCRGTPPSPPSTCPHCCPLSRSCPLVLHAC
jgi:hypothetical protein